MSDRGDETDRDSEEETAEDPGEGREPEDDIDDGAELDEDLRPTPLPVLAAVLAFLLPPVGVVLGHVAVRRTYWRLGLSRLAVVAGWTMTVLSVCGLLLYLSHREDVARMEALAAAEAQTEEQLRQAIAESPSLGLLDEEFCRALGEVAEMMPVTGFVTSADQVDSAMVEGYGELGSTDTPNAQVYKDYAQYLVSFADHGTEEHVAHAEGLQEAVTDDVLACLPVMNESLR